MCFQSRIYVSEVAIGLALLVSITAQWVTAATNDSGLLESEPLIRTSSPQGPTRFVKLDPRQIGIDFVHRQESGKQSQRVLSDTLAGGGVCIGDYDGDRLPDVVLTRPSGGFRLYRNTGHFRFQDVTVMSGLGKDKAWSTGASFADLDGDGDLDLFVCGYAAPNRLYVNLGNGRFREQGRQAGLDYRGASTMMSFADIDLDGDLDGYLVTYRLYGQQKTKFKKGRFTNPEDKDLLIRPDGTTMVIDAGQYDHLYLNNGNGTFTNISAQAGISGNHQGLSATWWDFNQDRLPDLYVANDYWGPDHLYRNNGDGTFTDVARHTLPHMPWYSMGSDVGDINNDGLFDFMATDMAGTDHYKQKVTMGDMADSGWFLTAADPQQYMRNAVYLNTGSGRCREVAKLVGLSSTDWTWSVKFGDLDNDGWLDLFVTNGMTRDYFNADVLAEVKQAGLLEQAAMWTQQPRKNDTNLAFRNRGDLKFEQVQQPWGLDLSSVSYGAGLADFDRDGDLDILINNFEGRPTVYRNTTGDGEDPSRAITVSLSGTLSNRLGIGAAIHIETAQGTQARYLTLARGYLSTNDILVHFGLGKQQRVDRLTVTWPSGQVQTFHDLAVDRRYTITEPESTPPPGQKEPVAPMFAHSSRLSLIDHIESPYNDYQDQPLLPHKLSQLGPGMAWGDVDGDRDADLFVGQAAGYPGFLYINQGQGEFTWSRPKAFEQDQGSEDMGAVFFDADGDNDLDLYVASGGYQMEAGDARYRDRLYLNDGKGFFVKAAESQLPDLRTSTGAVAAADFDRDGDLDLFVGGRVVPGEFPLTPSSHLLQNQQGTFTDVTEQLAPELARTGLVTSALFSDVDSDSWLDLLVTHEWGPVRIYHNVEGTLQDNSPAAGTDKRLGWFHGIAASDLDADGDIDYVVTNVGLNTKYHASVKKPIMIHYGDFGQDGVMRLVEADYENDKLLPMRGKSCSTNAMPFLADRFTTFHDFALASLTDIYTPKCLKDAHRLEANTLESGVLLNDGNGHFGFRPLPRIAQCSTSYGCVVTEVNGDGIPDLYLAQNFFGPQPETGRYDGGVSQLLTGNGDGTFSPVAAAKSGLIVPQDAKGLAITDINQDGQPDFILSINNGEMQVFENQQADREKILKLHVHGPPGNPNAIGARVTVRTGDGRTQTSEIYAGGSYLSQSSNELFFGLGANPQVEEVTISWPDGTRSQHVLPLGDSTTEKREQSLVVSIDHPQAVPAVVSRDPVFPELTGQAIRLHRELATALADQNQADRASKHLRHLLTLVPDNAAIHRQLADAYAQTNDFARATEHFEQAMTLQPGHVEDHVSLAQILVNQSDPDAAVRHYNSALKLVPDHVAAHLALAQLNHESSQTDEALQHVQSVLRITGDNREAHLLAGKVYWKTKKIEQSKIHFSKLLQLDPEDHDAHFYLGYIASRQQNSADTIHHFQEFVSLFPHNLEVRKLLALALVKAKKWQQAADHFGEVVNMESSYDPEIHQYYANALLHLDQFDAARTQCEYAISLDPKSPVSHNLMGQSLASLGKTSDAIQHFEYAIKQRPNFVEARANRATALAEQGDYEQAVAGFRRVLQSTPNDSIVHRNLGQAYQQLGKRKLALNHLQRAIELNPRDARAHQRLGMIYVRGRRLQEALKHFQKVAELDPNSAEAHYRVGLALYQLRRYDDAIEVLRGSVKLAPQKLELSNLLAWILATHGDTSKSEAAEAVKLAAQVAEQTEHKNSMYLDTLAAAYAASGQFDEAAKTARQAISLVLKTESKDQDSLASMRDRLRRYQKRQPYVEAK